MKETTPEELARDVRASVEKTVLQKESSRLPRWAMVVMGLFGVLLLLLLVLPGKRTEKRTATNLPSTQAIPESEIKPSYLAEFVQGEKVEKKKDKESSSIAFQPSGSLAVFIADGNQTSGILGIPMGTEIAAFIEQGSEPIIAKVSQDVAAKGQIKIPKLSRLFGAIQGENGHYLTLHFSRLSLPTGEDQPFSGTSTTKASFKRRGMRGLSILSGAALGSTGVFLPQGSGYGDTFGRNVFRGGMQDIAGYQNPEATPKIKPNKKIKIIVDRPL